MTTLAAVGAEDFVSLSTFRRTGRPVATPVWVASDGEGALLVTTPSGSGKVKRLRHTPTVEIRPCSRRGAVAADAPVARGWATIVDGAAEVAAAHDVLRAKYGLEFRVVMGVERLLRRGRIDRVILRITPAT